MFISNATRFAGKVVEFRTDLSEVVGAVQAQLQASGEAANFEDALVLLYRFAADGSSKKELIGRAIGP